MLRSRGDMASPRHTLLLLLAINSVAFSRAGPLGPLPNVTSVDLGLKEGSCALGDVVYMPGDEFPGSTPCERCTCTAGDVQCARQECEPRPGCKALHRPDQCCPTYQCECEQEGRVYGNGEKLVDPADPCRVCYCQGGEVVCRRIACFVRDDCTPRLVPGRCCPEYDNCPLRGVTSLPGVTPIPNGSLLEKIETPSAPIKENIKPEITIKEITPVSEIPVITEVKIKEILPSPSIEVAEYSSSKSPLIPREATSEKNVKESDSKTESPSVVEVHLSSPVASPESTQFTDSENKDVDSPPSKISFSTQDSSSIYPSNIPIVATMGVSPITAEPFPMATTKAPIIEEEDTFDHNPAFPPLPDDFAVLRNHDDELVPEPVVDNEHVPSHDIVASALPSTEAEVKEPEPLTTSTTKDLPDTTTTTTTTTTQAPTTTQEITTPQPAISTQDPFKESPMVNLRSAIPTELLNTASLVPEEVNASLDETSSTSPDDTTLGAVTTTEAPKKVEEIVTENVETTTELKTTTPEIKTSSEEIKVSSDEIKTATDEPTVVSEEAKTSSASSESATQTPEPESTTVKAEIEAEMTTKQPEQTTSEIAKSNVATEVTSQTELSSLPVETSDQNPPEVSEQTTSDKASPSTIDPLTTSSRIPSSSSEVITVSRAASNENIGFENVETTEFILTSFGSSETATDAVELIKISADPQKSAAIIDPNGGNKNNNALTDLIKLISDVASMGDHTDEPDSSAQQTTTVTSISDSEELIPVNAGYKSKNKNFNQNSITEIPLKSKISSSVTKQKVVEIEDDESEGVTDSPPPYDKVEPTTRRPIIDNVSDDVNISDNKTAKKDIEIITQSYVPTINRRPTKVIMKKNNEKPASNESTVGSASVETSTDSSVSNESPIPTSAESSASAETSPAVESSGQLETNAPSAEVEPSAEIDTSATTARSDAEQ
ncbi:uncharacterized protein LOC142987881 [Anticarsia gemmatalis]|uniref:uncharacterized protein LOC142987881 n=1 Tax=Anticarsia gemmatalis TaxID=129554 RepID=UPI003F7701FA